ncbi:MAG: lactate utilization protein [Chloroflexota bacterium]
MKPDRDSMLERIRKSLQSAHLPAAREAIPPRPWPTLQPALGLGALADSFTREAAALGATVHRPESEAQATEAVLAVLRESGGNEILAWADSDLAVRGLGEAIRAAGFTMLDPTVPRDPAPHREKLAELGRAVVGVTGALGGLADTGTLALLTGPTRSRMASLLPPIHIALLPLSRIYSTMAAFFTLQSHLVGSGSNLVFVTGPSRTADIELTLTIGVHGPKAIHIVLIP